MTRRLRVGLDAHMVGSQETGNETYVRGLVDGLFQLDREFEVRVYHVGKPWHPQNRRVQFEHLMSPSAGLRLGADLPLRALKDRLDVLHMTYTAPLWAPCPLVLTVHDISYVSHPEWFSARDRRLLAMAVPRSIGRAAQVVTVSETCRSEIIAQYGAAEDRVTTIPNAAGPAAQPISDHDAESELKGLGLDAARPYILAVGNLQPRKNMIRLIEAFRNVVGSGHDIDLLIVGPHHYQADRILLAAHETSARIKFTGYLSDRQLAACYHCAQLFVFPSLFEGFGIPNLEAMAHGVPVATSSGGALPEVCGTAATYFDPLDIDSMAAAIERVLTDARLRAELRAKGRLREREFTWVRSAELTLSVYQAADRGSRTQ